jgi:hypothetical protein
MLTYRGLASLHVFARSDGYYLEEMPTHAI